MESRVIICVLVAVCISHCSALPFNISSASTKCGEALTAPTSGIVYKPFEGEVVNNERCVWIISVPEASQYKVDIHYIGYSSPSGDTGLVVSGVKLRNGDRFIQWNPQETGSHTFTNDGSYGHTSSLVVTFFANPSAAGNSGFILEYTATAFGHSNIVRDANSQDYLITPEVEQVRHPSSVKESYNWHDLSTFVFLPKDNVIRDNTVIDTLYSRVGLAGYDGYRCNDALQVYFFNPAAAAGEEKWEYQGPKHICSDNELMRLQHNDLILLSFYADMSSMGQYDNAKGFNLINLSNLH